MRSACRVLLPILVVLLSVVATATLITRTRPSQLAATPIVSRRSHRDDAAVRARHLRDVHRWYHAIALARHRAEVLLWDTVIWKNALAAQVPSSAPFSSWQCVADAESGGDWHAHSSTFSSAFGMLNEAVRERADSPASAARILAGTASPAEQERAARRELDRYGAGAWGPLTRQKCGG